MEKYRESLADLPMRNGQPHSCAVCRGEVRQPANGLRCKVVWLRRQAEAAIEKRLRRRRLWRGSATVLGEVRRYRAVSSMLEASGGAVDYRWPVRLVELAEVLAAVRRVEHSTAEARRAEAATARG
jgi:hypothetical protein